MTIFRYVLIVCCTLGVMAASTGRANDVIPVVQSSANANNAALFYQLETLQQEVQTLRGIVEEQEHQIKRMSAAQLDRYLDLDRRLTLLSQPVVNSVPDVTVKPDTASSPVIQSTPVVESSAAIVAPVTSPELDALSEKDTYQAAFSLVRNREYKAAISAFEALITAYPDGDYTGNAYYWLGEIWLVEVDYKQALSAFEILLDSYPEHRKTAAAKYKQGKIYLQLGDKARAKQMLQSVVEQYAGSSAATLAAAEIRKAQL
jgi:tol-pal system protein YbgF